MSISIRRIESGWLPRKQGFLRFCTELGVIDLEPQEIAIQPRGLACENDGQDFTLPARGQIGANGMAYPRDVKTRWRRSREKPPAGGLFINHQ